MHVGEVDDDGAAEGVAHADEGAGHLGAEMVGEVEEVTSCVEP